MKKNNETSQIKIVLKRVQLLRAKLIKRAKYVQTENHKIAMNVIKQGTNK
jgi:hypothetical protein